MAKVSSTRTTEKEYTVPLMLCYHARVSVVAKTQAAAAKKAKKIKPRKFRKLAECATLTSGQPIERVKTQEQTRYETPSPRTIKKDVASFTQNKKGKIVHA